MTTIEIDGDDAADGLIALVVAVVELLVEALEREAVRRMESDRLTDEEIERLGRQLAALEEEVERMKEEHDVGNDVDRLRADLDGLVAGAVRSLDERERNRGARETEDRARVGRDADGRDADERDPDGRDADGRGAPTPGGERE